MGEIRLRVGASVDANVATMYKPLLKASQDAAKQVAKALGDASPYRSASRAIAAAQAEQARGAKKQADGIAKDVARAARERVTAERAALREIERDLEQHNRKQERERAKTESEAKARATRMARIGSGAVVRGAAGTFNAGKRIAGDIARGAGIDFNVGGLAKSFIERQSQATQLSNAAWIEQGGPNEAAKTRVDPKVLMAEANAVAMQTGIGAEDALSAMSAFVTKTGDLQTARELIKDMSILAKSTGTSLEDMVSAAGEMSNAFGDIPDKGKVISDTMRVIAAQGQIGAVEMKDLASQMGKLASQANNFKLGDSTAAMLARQGITDPTGQNIAVMGGLAQMARQHGGKVTAQQATQSAMAYIRDFSSNSSMKRLEKEAGITAFTDKSKTTIRDPKALMLDLLDKSKGNLGLISRWMPNQNSRAVQSAFGQVYTKAREGATGTDAERHTKALRAASDEFDKMMQVTLSNEHVQKNFAAAMSDGKTKAQLFQNQLQQVADSTMARLLPALERLAPHIERAAGAFGDFVTWASEHPGQLVGAAIAGSIAKAGIETSIRTGIEALLTGAAKGGGGAGVLGAAAPMFTIAAAAVTITSVGMMAIDQVLAEDRKKDAANVVGAAQGHEVATRVLARGGGTEEDAAALRKYLEETRTRIAEQEETVRSGGSWYGRMAETAAGWVDPEVGIEARRAREQEEQRSLQLQVASNERIERALAVIAQNTGRRRMEVVDRTPRTESAPVSRAPVGGEDNMSRSQ